MCGICGKLAFGLDAPPISPAALSRMSDALAHRGPDAAGMYHSGPVGLGHRRLSIIDLHTGAQPLCNEDGTVWVVYNGEVYNYKELTEQLVKKGHRFKTATDTEVIVHLYEEMGDRCVEQLRGMFSFALWDDKTKTLLLARDRVGIKPLYYHLSNTSLLFASEIKALLTDPDVRAEVTPAGVARFLTYFYTPGNETLFRNIRKLEPGHYLTVRNGATTVTQYWDLSFQKTTRTFESAAEELETLLGRTVRDHMISDVPVGVLLSGGVDSSGVLSYAIENTNKALSTFTVGFDGGVADERPYAKLAASRVGAHHFEITLSAQDFWHFLPQYVWHMEEPVCEPPAIALYYVSKLAREHVTVLLSGEGGDEAFAGYPSYRTVSWLERLKRWLGPLAKPTGRIMQANGGNGWVNRYGSLFRTGLQDYYYSHSSTPASVFNSGYADLYTPDLLGAVGQVPQADVSRRYFERVKGLDCLDQLLYVDTKTWLPDDLLIKADRMTMATSVELRVPFLDHQILEFAASLPASFKLHHFNTKHILKHVLRKRIPREIVRRKKAGFPVPYARWLTDELHGAVSEILLDRSTLDRGYFRKGAIERLLRSTELERYGKEIFSLVALELWHRQFV